MEEMVNLIVSNSMSVVIIGYFLFKDYKFQESLVNTLKEMNVNLTTITTQLANHE